MRLRIPFLVRFDFGLFFAIVFNGNVDRWSSIIVPKWPLFEDEIWFAPTKSHKIQLNTQTKVYTQKNLSWCTRVLLHCTHIRATTIICHFICVLRTARAYMCAVNAVTRTPVVNVDLEFIVRFLNELFEF